MVLLILLRVALEVLEIVVAEAGVSPPQQPLKMMKRTLVVSVPELSAAG